MQHFCEQNNLHNFRTTLCIVAVERGEWVRVPTHTPGQFGACSGKPCGRHKLRLVAQSIFILFFESWYTLFINELFTFGCQSLNICKRGAGASFWREILWLQLPVVLHNISSFSGNIDYNTLKIWRFATARSVTQSSSLQVVANSFEQLL